MNHPVKNLYGMLNDPMVGSNANVELSIVGSIAYNKKANSPIIPQAEGGDWRLWRGEDSVQKT